MSKCLPLALVLSAVLFVGASFGATKKNQHSHRSRDWNESPLVNDDLPSPGNSLYSGNSGWDWSSTLGNSGSSLILNSPGTFNNWNGGVGNWRAGSPGAIQSLSPGQAVIWNGGAGTWFSDPTHWTCLPQGSLCGPPNGPGWDVNIGDSGINGTVLLNMPASVDQVALGVAGVGTLNVSGSNTLTTIVTIVGNSQPGSGTLNIGGGGSVSDTTGYIGALSGSVGSVNVMGAGSQWNTSGSQQLFIGDYGRGTLTVSNGGVVTSNGAILGFQSGSSSNVTVRGAGSQWNDSGLVSLGSAGRAALTINGGGVVNVAGAALGLSSGSVAIVTVDGAGSQLNSSVVGLGEQGLIIGNIGKGTLTIENGGLVNSTGASIGFLGGSVGSVLVGGIGSQWNNTGDLIVGGDGQGTLTIENGGVVNNGSGIFGGGAALNNQGFLDVEHGSLLSVMGDVENAGNFYMNRYGNGGGNTLTITGNLTNTGSFQLNGPGDMASIGGDVTNHGFVELFGGSTLMVGGALTNNGGLGIARGAVVNVSTLSNGNNGSITVAPGSTLNLTNQPNGITDVLDGSSFGIAGTFTAGGNPGFANLNSVEGQVILEGPTFTDTPGSGTLSISSTGQVLVSFGSAVTISGNLMNAVHGFVDVVDEGTLQVGGDAENSGILGTGFSGVSGGNILTILGILGNEVSGQFILNGPVDMATLGGLNNTGFVDVENGSTLQINGNVNNSGTIATDFNGLGGGNTLNIKGAVTNQAGGQLILTGPNDTSIIGIVPNSGLTAIDNSGFIDLENGSALTVNGNMNNSGSLYTSFYGGSGDNTITINGTLTNNPGSQFALLNSTDKLIINGGINLSSGAALSTPTLNNGGTINVDNLSTLLVGLAVLRGPGPSANYTQLANGTLGEMISSTNFGVINVNGSALLDGTLAVLLQGGYNPAVGSMYKFLLANPGQINGTFASILNDVFNGGTEKWLVNYDNADGFVELTAEANNVPEPATLLVLIPGLLGMAYGLRRRSMR